MGIRSLPMERAWGESMTCNYCGKASCRHQHTEGREKIATRSLRNDNQPPVGIGDALSTRKSARSLFELTNLHELLCLVCAHVIPNGPHQGFLRARHGQWHVSRGDAVEVTRGLPPEAVRFEIVKGTA